MSSILNILKDSRKKLALLIDPEKNHTSTDLAPILERLSALKPDFIFVGGSTVSHEQMDRCLKHLKAHTNIPLIIFPGSHEQINDQADGILYLSLLSGRNPDYLIGQQVRSAKSLKDMEIETISTAYLLVDGGKNSSVAYVSQTSPIPNDQVSIAVNTAVAGQLLGFGCVFMDAGSGALNSVSTEMIGAVKEEIDIPLIIGGGLKSISDIENAYEAGADVVVIGNKIEEDIDFMLDMVGYFSEKRNLKVR